MTQRSLELLVQAGRFTARKAAEWYRSVDPDVPRHLLQLPVAALTMLPSPPPKIRRVESDGHAPIIFVHGLGGGPGNFLPMATYLRFHGRKRSYRISFDSKQGLEKRADALARFIGRVRAANGASQVDLVAHSLGGIIVRIALARPRLARSVRTLVTLGTPHHGTYPARYLNSPILRDLRPDGRIIRLLQHRPWPRSVRGVALWSRNDLMVLPPESACLEGMESVDMSPFTHYSYLIHPRSWEAVRRALA
ncbi:MAG: alpha/beta fold hydrolase [Nitrospirae bacterium]|nr:alpha/beta fold hydrolase [Nitrospirota bacterium]